MGQIPKLSVIIPVYNTSALVERCIRSVFEQGLDLIEIIAVNDGSDDDSLAVLNKIRESDSRLIVLDQPNMGASSARNNGLKVATGDYVMFVDSDDYLLPKSLKPAMVKAFNLSSSPDIIYMGMQRKGLDGNIVQLSQKNKVYADPEVKCLFKQFDQLYFGSPCMKLFSYKILVDNNIKYKSDAKYYEDSCFNYEFIVHCKEAVSVSDIVYCYDCYSNAGSHLTASFVSDQWILDLQRYADIMDKHGNSINDFEVYGGGYFICWQVVYAIFSIYRSDNPHRFYWLRKLMQTAQILVPKWTTIPQKGVTKLIARSASISPILCHMICSLIFTTEKIKNKIIKKSYEDN